MRSLARWTLTAVIVLLAIQSDASPALAQERAPDTADTLRLDLGAVIRMASERSAVVELERFALLEAQAKVTEERADLLPHVSFDYLHGRRSFNTASFGIDFPSPPGEPPLFDPNGQVIGPVANVDLRGHLSQTLFDWSAIERLRSSRASLEASRERTNEAADRAAATAAAAYVQALRAQDRLHAREEDLELAQDLVAGARALLASGVGVRIDVTRAESQLASIQAELVGARSAADRNRLALLRALSLPLDTPIRLEATLPGGDTPPVDADAAVARALAERSELREIAGRIDAARLDVDAVRAERLPTLSFVGAEGWNAREYGHLLNTYDWTFRVSLPVFDGRRRSAREEEERAQLSALETRRREMGDQIAFEVRDAVLQLTAARDLVAASAARLALAEAEVAQARDRFQAGVAGNIDVVIASIRLSEARAADVDAHAAYQSARVTLAAAEGDVEDLR